MSYNKYKLEILKNIKFQNKLLLKKYEFLVNNQIVSENILKKLNCLYEIIDIVYGRIIMNNILLFCILILQIFILFK
jgi:hypothetical protein